MTAQSLNFLTYEDQIMASISRLKKSKLEKQRAWMQNAEQYISCIDSMITETIIWAPGQCPMPFKRDRNREIQIENEGKNVSGCHLHLLLINVAEWYNLFEYNVSLQNLIQCLYII